jgi:ATP-dependent Clp protease ATP-binding subunit ClpB
VDFRNTVVIMTSNIRSRAALTEYFRPEFLNRVDEVIEFGQLTREEIAQIVELQLARLRARLTEKEISLELTDAAKEAIVEAGWDPSFGARPLKRALQRLIENPLAMRLLEGEFAAGNTVRVDVRDGELVFTGSRAAGESDIGNS